MLGPRCELGVERDSVDRERARSLATDTLPQAVEVKRRQVAGADGTEESVLRTTIEDRTAATHTFEMSFSVRSTAPPNENERVAPGRLSLPVVEAMVKPSHSASKKLSIMGEIARKGRPPASATA